MLDIANSAVLITGGTGSFGRTMARRLLVGECPRIRVFSRDEAKQDAMRSEFRDERLEFHLGDVRDRHSVDRAVQDIDLVFHAAALKQVPSCEFFPMQAVQTNVIGSANVIEAAGGAGVDKVVCLSTDKAVFPVNAMGMTKAIMEKVALAEARRGKSTVCCVRYGNVMFSRGSVIPLFARQLLDGVPLTITDPSMTRFLLPLSEAVELVEVAWRVGESGDILIRKAPAATIGDLAEAMKMVFEREVPTEVIGTRHGEKVFETLVTAEELRRAEDLDDYFRVRMDGRDLDYSIYVERGEQAGDTADYHSHNAERLTVERVVDLLRTLPELQPSLRAAGVL